MGERRGKALPSTPEVFSLDSNTRLAGKQFAAGACAGVVAKTVIAPLDRIKIMFQVSQQRFSYAAVRDHVRHIVATEGATALFKGNIATMARVVPYSGIQLMSFDQYSQFMLRRRGARRTDRLSGPEKMLTGAMAGATSVLVTYPLDLMRARLAVQRVVHKYESLPHAFSTAIREEGALALYRGVGPTLLGILPYAGLAFFTFESTKQFVHDFTGQEPTALHRLLCGGVAGFVGQTATYPLDLARRRMQTESFIVNQLGRAGWTWPNSSGAHALVEHSGNNVKSIWLSIIRREGYRGLVKGLSMNWIKGPISVGISLTLFDLIKQTVRGGADISPMRAIVTRVLSANVTVGGRDVSSIGHGLLALVGICRTDTLDDLAYIVSKLLTTRLFADGSKQWSLGVKDVGGELLLVSQFTLYGVHKGTKMDWSKAMGTDEAREFFAHFVASVRSSYVAERVKEGEFGAMMEVGSVNDGPVTLVLDSRQRRGPDIGPSTGAGEGAGGGGGKGGGGGAGSGRGRAGDGAGGDEVKARDSDA